MQSRRTGCKICLAVGMTPLDAATTQLLRTAGYLTYWESTFDGARTFLRHLVPQLAIIHDLPSTDHTQQLFSDLRALSADVVAVAPDELTLILAERLGFLLATTCLA